ATAGEPANNKSGRHRPADNNEVPMRRWRLCLKLFILTSGILPAGIAAFAQQGAPPARQGGESEDLGVELGDPKALRVCADPSSLPFSNEQGQGFENKLAELLAAKLGKGLAYTWYPQAPGFVRNTLAALKCDLIMGYPQGNDLVQSTNPYYRTSYALMLRPGSGLDGADTLADPRLKSKHIGIVAGTPPATLLAANGLMTHAKPYPLVLDTRVDSS